MLKIQGHSDDIIEATIELQSKCPCCGADIEEPTSAVVGGSGDEIGAYDQKVHFTVGDLKGGVEVVMFLASTGCWAAMVGQVGEDVPIPWQVRIGAGSQSVEVCVDCPDGTPVRVEKEDVSG